MLNEAYGKGITLRLDEVLETEILQLLMGAAGNFRRVGGFEKQGEGLDQVGSGLFDGHALTGNIEFRAEGDKGIVFEFDNGDQRLAGVAGSSGGYATHASTTVS